MEVHHDDVSMEDAVVEPMPRRTKGRGGRGRLRSQSKTLDHPNNPFFLDANEPPSQGYAPQRSIEGWIVLITGIHEEAQEDHILNAFGDYGEIKNLHMNLDRRTGFAKGNALIEYETFEEADAAISAMNGAKLFGRTILVNSAFMTGPFGSNSRRSPQLNRSRSPRMKY